MCPRRTLDKWRTKEASGLKTKHLKIASLTKRKKSSENLTHDLRDLHLALKLMNLWFTETTSDLVIVER